MTKYPLLQIQEIKQKRLDEAEKTLKEKKRLLEVELEKLKKAEEKRDLIKKHKQDKIKKFFEEMGEGTSSEKILTHDRYLKKVVAEELKVEEKKVVDQTKVMRKAEEEVEKARKEYIKKNQDVEKLRIHKKEWTLDAEKEGLKVESSENDELGSNIYSMRKRGGKRH